MPDLDEPITTQEQLDKVLKDRLARERAKYGDYDDLKAKAARLDTIEAEKQTADEKTAKDIRDLQEQLSKTQRESARRQIAADHKLTDPDDIAAVINSTDDDVAAKLAKRLADLAEAQATRETEGKKKSANRVPKEGTKTAEPKDDEMREVVRNLFGAGSD